MPYTKFMATSPHQGLAYWGYRGSGVPMAKRTGLAGQALAIVEFSEQETSPEQGTAEEVTDET